MSQKITTTYIKNKKKTKKMTTDLILKKLDKLEKGIEYIKEHLIDPDTIMTEDDYKAIEAYQKEKAAGKLISHKKVKEELGL